jgi:hypothetical protein
MSLKAKFTPDNVRCRLRERCLVDEEIASHENVRL